MIARKASDFKVGQEVWFVRNHHYNRPNGPGEPHVVKTVGRTWITACPPNALDQPWQSQRFNPETMRADGKGYSSPGDYYLSEQDYKDEGVNNDAWESLKRYAAGSRPKHLTADAIRAVLAQLKGEGA